MAKFIQKKINKSVVLNKYLIIGISNQNRLNFHFWYTNNIHQVIENCLNHSYFVFISIITFIIIALGTKKKIEFQQESRLIIALR